MSRIPFWKNPMYYVAKPNQVPEESFEGCLCVAAATNSPRFTLALPLSNNFFAAYKMVCRTSISWVAWFLF